MRSWRHIGRGESHARGGRVQLVQASRALAEALEARRLLSAAVVPVLHPLHLSANAKASASAGAVAATSIYGALNGLGKSAKGAAAAVAARALAPFDVNMSAIQKVLASAPLETALDAAAKALVFPIPMPDGLLSRFKVVEAPIMEPGLAAQFPQIKTFRGVGIDDPTASLRMDYTPLGFHAQVLSTHGSYYIDPFFRNDATGTYASYYKRDVTNAASWKCDVVTPSIGLSAKQEGQLDAIYNDSLSAGAMPLALTYGTQLKTYRAAVAADGEYVAAVGGGTVTGGESAVVTAINRVTGVYETELDIRLVLVANNSSLIYTNASTDPYTNSNSNSLLTQNQSNIDSIIGNANYDIGHVFTTGGGGLAALGVVGKTGAKAEAETGNPSPTGDSFWIDYVAHEMGHQFGANHTFNTANDTSNRNASTAYEPGSGSTIMAYAGIEGSEDLQPHSDPYFHSASIDEIRSYITSGTIANVGTATATGNNGPTVSAGSSYTIPTGTPFVLTASGSDPDGDPLTYDWQERDLGAATLLTDADNGSSPILRDWPPSTSASRVVPRLSDLLNNTFAPGEKLPAVARASFKWRVIARDNKIGGGGVASSDVTLSVVNTGSAFAVTSPNTAVTWYGNDSQTVTWNVAGTTGNGINTANVNILLSTDGGNTYPITLAANTPNDGSQTITVPASLDTSTARIEVEAVGNIFFDISNASFTISSTPPPPATIAGQVYEDRNADGVFNGNDVPLNGALIFLDTNNNGILDSGETSVITSGSGNYSFSPLADGTYHVRQQLSNVVATFPANGEADVSAVQGSASSQNFLCFPTLFSGTNGNDDYGVRLTTSSNPAPFYSDNFNRSTLSGGAYAYSTTATAGDGGASIAGSNILTLTNDASAAANGNGTVYVATPTSAFAGFNQKLSLDSGVMTWSFNMQQSRTNPSGFASGNYGAAFILGSTNSTFTGAGAGNGYAVVLGNSSTPDPIRLVKFAGGLAGTLTTLASTSTQNASNHYWSVEVSFDPSNNQWSLYTRDDGTSTFADPLASGAYTQSGSTVADTTYTNVNLTQAGALWAYSTGVGQAAQFDNINFSVASTAPRLEILVAGVVTYSAPPTLPTSLSFEPGDGDDTLTIDSTAGSPPFPINFAGGSGNDTWRFVGGTNSITGDAGAVAENIELSSSAILNLNASQKFQSLTIGSISRANIAAGGSNLLELNTLSIAPDGALDLNDNELIVNAGDVPTIQAWVLQGYSDVPDSSKTGIISTTGQTAPGNPILAIFSNSYVGSADYPFGSGNTISANAVVGKYTYFGDLNIDGMVTADDYGTIDANFGATGVSVGQAWIVGDTNFDGMITADDYGALDANFGLGVGNPLAPLS